MNYETVLKFWFDEIEAKQRWIKDADFDQLIRDRFADCHTAATRGELSHWRESAEGRLAEIIVLDQFSRNMFRQDPRSFIYDTLALVLAQSAIQAGADVAFYDRLTHLSFLYMPFMHSESALIHVQAVELFSRKGMDSNLEFEFRHKAIIDRFGRYPHRNAVLGRSSSAEELEFLTQKNSSF